MAEEGRRSRVKEGGWGWMIVAGCFLANICTRAVTRCVSIFFIEFQQNFGRDYSSTAWIHSTIDGITMFCAPLGGFLGNHFSCRSIVMAGGLLSFTGMVLSSFATSLPYLYVTMGIVTGLGFALSYTPSVAMVGNYFHERKALAYGIGLSGSGIGTFILAPAVQLLIELYSWRGALLVLGGFVANLCVCGALLRPVKPKPEEDDRIWEDKMAAQKDYEMPKNTDLISLDLTKEELAQLEHDNANNSNNNKSIESRTVASMNLKNTTADKDSQNFLPGDANMPRACIVSPKPCGLCLCLESKEEFRFLFHPDFLILLVSVLFMAFGCSAPLVYLVPYALSVGVDHQNAAFLMSIFGISSIVGNITFGWITDRPFLKKHRLLNYMCAVLMEGLCCMVFPFLLSFPGLAVCVVLYGYFDGAYVALIPVVVSDVVGPSCLTPALGVVYFLHAVPYLVSPPIGGLLVDTTGAYTSTFHLCGASYVISAGILTVAMAAKRWWSSKSTSVV
ncbi:monocarboxylate transporter 12-B-like [Periophthalmus magnuspinnatus]|uniref:monocarboxylate transporter 12-B-like n=1 Tax=Periophthalmus magnuspinnatus TaxID=409849 RepID=UPI00145B6D48|nr:monocarboxylate transporter 12-B-like [Periophthalmus magnuspinnatus]